MYHGETATHLRVAEFSISPLSTVGASRQLAFGNFQPVSSEQQPHPNTAQPPARCLQFFRPPEFVLFCGPPPSPVLQQALCPRTACSILFWDASTQEATTCTTQSTSLCEWYLHQQSDLLMAKARLPGILNCFSNSVHGASNCAHNNEKREGRFDWGVSAPGRRWPLCPTRTCSTTTRSRTATSTRGNRVFSPRRMRWSSMLTGLTRRWSRCASLAFVQ